MIGPPPISLPSASASRACWRSHASLSSSSHRYTVSRLAVRHLDADHVAAGHGGDAHGGDRQAAGHVVGQADHAGAADAGRRFQFVQRHHRAGADFDDLALHAVIGQHRFQQPGIGLQRLLAGRADGGAGGRGLQQVERREAPAAFERQALLPRRRRRLLRRRDDIRRRLVGAARPVRATGRGRGGTGGAVAAGSARGRLRRRRAPAAASRARRGVPLMRSQQRAARRRPTRPASAAEQPGRVPAALRRLPRRHARPRAIRRRSARAPAPPARPPAPPPAPRPAPAHRADQVGAGGQRVAFQHQRRRRRRGPAAVGQGMAAPCGPGTAASTAPSPAAPPSRAARRSGRLASPRCEPIRQAQASSATPGQHAGEAEALQQQVGHQRARRGRPDCARPGRWRCPATGRAGRSRPAPPAAPARRAPGTPRPVPPDAGGSATAAPRRRTAPLPAGLNGNGHACNPRFAADSAAARRSIPHSKPLAQKRAAEKENPPPRRGRGLSGRDPAVNALAELFAVQHDVEALALLLRR